MGCFLMMFLYSLVIRVFQYFNFFGIFPFPVFIARYVIHAHFLLLRLYCFVAPSRFFLLLLVSMGNDDPYDLQTECHGG